MCGESSDERSLSFVGDVLPILSKAGCNSSGCHANPDGQNGFKLTVFSYDPRADHESIVKEGRGRRLSLSAPEQSLFLLKPTQALPHEGGQRIKPNSPEYQTLVRWIREGAVYQLEGEPELQEISVGEEKRAMSRGAVGALQVTAAYSDGSQRDVTALAGFTSSDDSFVAVNEAGGFKVGQRPGEGVLVARYMGQVAITRISVAPAQTLPAERYQALPRFNFIDDLAIQRWEELGIFPADLCSDSEFIRRASIDLIGTLPSAERVRAFLKDERPDKRARLVDELLAHPNWADRWALVWIDLMRPNPDRVGVKSVYILDQWLRQAFRENRPFDQFARDILTVRGSTHRDGPAVIFRDRRGADDLTTMMSQVFMGVRLECAKCHHHPNEAWSQDDFYQLAAFFGEVGRKGTGVSPPISGSPEYIYLNPGGKVSHPVTGAVMKMIPPGGKETKVLSGHDPRTAFADWLLAPENPYFARATVNRVWGQMMGKGFVNPVDDLRTSNPASHPELLEALAKDFAQGGFDLKQVQRRIVNSRVYQLSSVAGEHNMSDTTYFSRAYRRRLSAEAITDAVVDVTGVPNNFQGMPAGARALQTWNFKLSSDMLDAFGRPDSSEDCPCERNLESSVVQALHLMHAEGLQGKLEDKAGRVSQLVQSERSEAQIVEELYLTALGRLPTKDELAIAVEQYSLEGATRQTATEDVLWALINSAEFVFNH